MREAWHEHHQVTKGDGVSERLSDEQLAEWKRAHVGHGVSCPVLALIQEVRRLRDERNDALAVEKAAMEIADTHLERAEKAEAEAEIERLAGNELAEQVSQAEAEVERLNKAVDDLTVRHHRYSPCQNERDTLYAGMKAVERRAIRAEAERDRYREALETIGYDLATLDGVEAVARNALNRQEEAWQRAWPDDVHGPLGPEPVGTGWKNEGQFGPDDPGEIGTPEGWTGEPGDLGPIGTVAEVEVRHRGSEQKLAEAKAEIEKLNRELSGPYAAALERARLERDRYKAVVDAARRYQHGLNTKAPTTEVLRLGFDLRDALVALDQQENS